MPKFFGENSYSLLVVCCEQPISIEIDGASARCVGPCSPWHGRVFQQLHWGELFGLTLRDLSNQFAQLWRAGLDV